MTYRVLVERKFCVNEHAPGGAPVVHIVGTRATIRLNRPEVHNRLEPGDVIALRDAVARIDANETVRVLIITGTGESFSSGFDLRALSEGGERRDRVDFEAMADEIEHARPVTIARLNGPVYGGATDLALACDFRIGVDSARMFVPAAKFGLQYYGHGLQRWVSRCGIGAAKSVLLTGRALQSDEMVRIGYLDEAVPHDRLDVVVEALAASIEANAPLAVQGMKRMINDIARGDYDEMLSRDLGKRCRMSDDLKEGLAALEHKRPPQFNGR